MKLSGQTLQYNNFSYSPLIPLITLLIVEIVCQLTVICQNSKMYIYLVESQAAVNAIIVFKFTTS